MARRVQRQLSCAVRKGAAEGKLDSTPVLANPMLVELCGLWRAIRDLVRRDVIGVRMRDEAVRLSARHIQGQAWNVQKKTVVPVEHRQMGVRGDWVVVAI